MSQPAAILQSSLCADAIGTNQFDFFNVFFFPQFLQSSALVKYSQIQTIMERPALSINDKT
jgi:hypothetical protein